MVKFRVDSSAFRSHHGGSFMKIIDRCVWCVLLAALHSSCFAPATPGQRVSDAARELNVSARFGKMDLAASMVDASIRPDFMLRRAQWGREIRVVDVDLAAVEVQDETHATVIVDISWVPLRDNVLRVTRLSQSWQDAGHGWLLVRERRTDGDIGLFGESISTANPPHPDVHLPSRTIGPTGD
jgi:hypothetical protein